MKIYFSASISSAPKSHRELYLKITQTLKDLGHRVIAEHLFGKYAKQFLDKKWENTGEVIALHRKMIAWKHQADIVVVEASYPSISLGQEVSYAIAHNKPTIVLFLKGREPHILQSVGDDYLHLAEYDENTLKKVLTDYIEYAKDTADTRFNFFISSEIDAFLDWVSKERKVPRAVFLRQLIEEDLLRNRKYLNETGNQLKEIQR